MSTPVEPHRTAAAHDPHGSAAGDRDETAATSSPGGPTAAPRFGPPAAEGEVGVLGPYRVLKELGKGAWAPCTWPSTRGSTASWR